MNTQADLNLLEIDEDKHLAILDADQAEVDGVEYGLADFTLQT